MGDDAPEVPGDGPRIDGRRRDRIESDVRSMVPYYTDDWEPDEGDVGSTLLTLFAELAEEVTERLDRVPEKHRVAFYETLGFGRQPPQPATLPLSVEVADDAGENVTVPSGAVATAEASDGSEQLFEVPEGEALDATPANLTAVYSVDGAADAIYAHHDALSTGEDTTLFAAGENLQEHTLYLGDERRLSAGPGSELLVELDADADPQLLHDRLQWEYYGERTVDGETVEGWHPFPSQVDGMVQLAERLKKVPDGGWEMSDDVIDVSDSMMGADFALDRQTSYGNFAAEYPGMGHSATVTTTHTALERHRLAKTHLVATGQSDIDRLLASLPDGYPGFDTDGDELPTWVKLLEKENSTRTEEGTVQLKFVPDGTLTKTTVDGVKSKWLRCRLHPDGLSDLFGLRLGGESDGPPVEVGATATDLEPDKLLHNEVPQPQGSGEDAKVWPFGEHPRQQDTFYLASSDALTKSDAEVTVQFQVVDEGSGDPDLSWEYFDGDGWSRIPDLTDSTSSFTDFQEDSEEDTVSFDVPPDLAETTVAGHEGHWIRVRLVGGDYGKLQFQPVDGEPDRYEQKEVDIQPPSFSSVRLSYNQTEAPDVAVTENNLGFATVPTDEGSYQPFERTPVDGQALFLGFDAPLRDGPIKLLFELADTAYPPDFHPQVRWAYDDPETDGWTRPDVLDGTEGLTERGLVSLVFPESTESSSKFGRDLHWVRATATNDQFRESEDGDDENGDNETGATERRACGRVVETVPPAGKPHESPPTVRGLYPNTTWARNRRTIDGEVLGSSDGSVDQAFTTASTPVIEPTVWVDELAVLSEGSREALRERWPERTDLETDADGEPTAFWVRWERQPDLLDSGPEERHYTLDPIAGTVTFGDGTRGKIPPRGTDNVRASYATGGGAAGNVPAGAVSGFQQSIAFVDSVTNPIAGAAGADAEATGAVTDRAARQLRDRNRAVAPADVERIAMDASRQLARARCLPAMDRDGEYEPGWVTLLVVPESAARKPTPSATLREDVERAVAEQAPATLVGLDHLVVRGPSYVTVTVDVEVAATGGSVSALEDRVRGAIQSFLHPLTGGQDGDGWAFGELPCRSAFYELLEGVDRVDHVEDLSLTFETDRSTVTLATDAATPDTSPDALVHGGTHEVTATLATDGGEG